MLKSSNTRQDHGDISRVPTETHCLSTEQRLFPDNAIRMLSAGQGFSYSMMSTPEDLPLHSLTNIRNAEELIKAIQQDVAQRYCSHFNAHHFDRFSFGDAEKKFVKEAFFNHERFPEVLTYLDIDPKDASHLPAPGWNEVCLVKVGQSHEENGLFAAHLAPTHSYHVQLRRKGIGTTDFSTISVSGLLMTEPTEEDPNGCVALGIRSGGRFPNTFNCIAGVAQFTDTLYENAYSIGDVFRETELFQETGLFFRPDQIHPCAYLSDMALMAPSTEDMYYFFTVITNLTKRQLDAAWMGNPHEDKNEHQGLIYIPNTPEDIRNFLRNAYFGITEHRNDRRDEERELLHPAALALAAYANVSIEELRELMLDTSMRKSA